MKPANGLESVPRGSRSAPLVCRSGDARKPLHGLQVAKLAHACGKGGDQRLVDVKYAFCDDLAIRGWEDELVEALGALDVVEQPALTLVDVVQHQLAHAVVVFDAIDGREQRLLTGEIGQASAHVADDGELVLAG